MRRALVLAAAIAAFALPLPLMAAGKAHTVRIEGMKFVPERLEVAPGDSVTWVNADLVPHTVTAAAASIESGSIATKGSWKWIAARKAGEIRYVCRFHPGMQATLVVK